VARDELHDMHERVDSDEHDQEVASVAIHQHDVIPNKLPRTGTAAWHAGIGGAVIVGGTVGLLLALLASGVFAAGGEPILITGSNPLQLVMLTVAAAMFGGILAAIAGRAGNRKQVRDLETAVANGNVLLTLEAPRERTRSIFETMTRAGALRTGAL